jgi:hypothetical protein
MYKARSSGFTVAGTPEIATLAAGVTAAATGAGFAAGAVDGAEGAAA